MIELNLQLAESDKNMVLKSLWAVYSIVALGLNSCQLCKNSGHRLDSVDKVIVGFMNGRSLSGWEGFTGVKGVTECRLLPFFAAQPNCLDVRLNNKLHLGCEYEIKSKYFVPRTFKITSWYASALCIVLLRKDRDSDQVLSLVFRIVWGQQDSNLQPFD